MFATLVRLSKASRRSLTPKRGNKDFYKGSYRVFSFTFGHLVLMSICYSAGTGQAALPGGPRTGAPGKHVVRGKAKYRLIDEKVRYFVAPAIEDIVNSPVCSIPHSEENTTH